MISEYNRCTRGSTRYLWRGYICKNE